jgi:hypothetical protein
LIQVEKAEFLEWRKNAITKAMLEDVAEAGTIVAQKILTSDSFDGYRDQHLKGILYGLSQLDGWIPEFSDEVEVSNEA